MTVNNELKGINRMRRSLILRHSLGMYVKGLGKHEPVLSVSQERFERRYPEWRSERSPSETTCMVTDFFVVVLICIHLHKKIFGVESLNSKDGDRYYV
jgi:hypothetical protein